MLPCLSVPTTTTFIPAITAEAGLKTGMYYLRTKAARDAIKFTVEKKYQSAPDGQQAMEDAQSEEAIACSIENGPDCEMCSG